MRETESEREREREREGGGGGKARQIVIIKRDYYILRLMGGC